MTQREAEIELGLAKGRIAVLKFRNPKMPHESGKLYGRPWWQPRDVEKLRQWLIENDRVIGNAYPL